MKVTAIALGLVFALCAPARAQQTVPFDHVHLAVPDPAKAREWYLKHIGGTEGETPDRIAFAKWPGDHPLPVQILFMSSATAQPSAGSVIEAVAFSYPNLEEKVKEIEAAGAKLITPLSDVPGPWKRAVVQDPWGTTLELVQDPAFDLSGIHHVTLRVPNPDETLAWYVRTFGGERVKMGGQVDAIRYRDLNVIYLVALKGDRVAPSQGHSIDHLAWGPIDLDQVVNDLKARGTTFGSDPNPRGYPACEFKGEEIRTLSCPPPEQLPHRTVYVEAPNGVRIELVQHLEAGGH